MNTLHIFNKELRNYFNSTIAYVFLIFFLVIVGLFFYLSMVNYSLQSMFASRNPMMMQRMNPVENIITPIFGLMGFLLIFMIPVLTMRLFAEEKKLGTIELLFTYPITEGQLVLGKFLASMVVLLFIFLFSSVYFLLYKHAFSLGWPKFPLGNIMSGYLGLLLISLSFMAFGMWISSLTSDQVTAALSTVGSLLLFWIVGSARLDLIGNWQKLVEQLSMSDHFRDFTLGVIDTHHVVFMLCFIFFFLFLTIQILEVRKWKG